MADITVLLSPPSLTQSVYNEMKSELGMLMSAVTVEDSRPVTGLGDEAYIDFGTSAHSAEAYLLVVDGNAGIEIQYEISAIGGQAQTAPESQVESAVLAMARDIIRNLG